MYTKIRNSVYKDSVFACIAYNNRSTPSDVAPVGRWARGAGARGLYNFAITFELKQTAKKTAARPVGFNEAAAGPAGSNETAAGPVSPNEMAAGPRRPQ